MSIELSFSLIWKGSLEKKIRKRYSIFKISKNNMVEIELISVILIV